MRSKLVFCTAAIVAMLLFFSACSITSTRFKTPHKSTDIPFLKNDSSYYEDNGQKYLIWNQISIEYDRRPEKYFRLFDFHDMSAYFDNYDLKHLKHFDTSMLPDEWVPLYKYKNNYYVYSPGSTDTKKVVSDSLLIDYYHEPSYFVINTFEKINANQYRIETSDLGSTEKPDILNIYIVDPINSVAVWEYRNPLDSVSSYNLFVPKQNATRFALVVNSANEEPDEFRFDPIDFEKLLRKFKK